ncbi:MAG: hypothetical protein KKC68_06750, partial [Candidatus Thermoplasmatota archaeon]|nr:hypothetical protein [Candidatus Thermoplasmatota archaeon]
MNDVIPLLDSIRLILGILILGYASFSDIKIRRAANYLWIILGAGGLILLIIQYLLGGYENLYYLIFIPLM